MLKAWIDSVYNGQYVFHQYPYENGIPFSIRIEVSNTLTLVAIANGDAMLSGPNAKRFSSVNELLANLQVE